MKAKVLWMVLVSSGVTLGATLLVMNLTTGEKQIERQIERRYATGDPQFAHVLSVLLGPPVVPGNRVQVLVNGDRIFPAMLDAIRQAEDTITFETYIYWSGTIGQEFATALIERARAGVRVHVLLDWAGSAKMEQRYLDDMTRAGVDVVRYHKPHWSHLPSLNNRTHRKVLVVDGRIGFTGGVGIADQWRGDARDPSQWRDTHFRVEGPVVAQMQAVFSNAYFVPDPLTIRALVAAAARGVKIRIITPGEHIDAAIVRRASRASWGELLAAGIEIAEYAPTMFHCKALVVDGLFVSVGSTNFDIRSFRLNDEANLNVIDAAFAREQIAIFEADWRNARPVTHAEWLDRPWRERALERLSALLKSQL